MWHAAPWMDQKIGEWREDHFPLLNIYGVVITNERGRRMAYTGPIETDTKDRAERFARFIECYLQSHPTWEPRSKYWNEMYPVYGSDEYQTSGEEDNWKSQERAMDPDYGDIRLQYLG